MEVSLMVAVNGMHFRERVGMVIDELMLQAWEPVDKCDDPMLRYAVGGVCDQEMKMVMKVREDAAEKLSKSITALLIESMKQKDTTNGYPNKI